MPELPAHPLARAPSRRVLVVRLTPAKSPLAAARPRVFRGLFASWLTWMSAGEAAVGHARRTLERAETVRPPNKLVRMSGTTRSLVVLSLASLLAGCPDDTTPTVEGTETGSSGGLDSGSSSASSLTMTSTTMPNSSSETGSSSTEDPDAGTSDGETCVQGTWTGVFTFEFETSAFTPCEGEPQTTWWYEARRMHAAAR